MDKKELVARLTKIADMFEDVDEECFETVPAPVALPVIEEPVVVDDEDFLFASKLTKLASELLADDKVADMGMQRFEMNEQIADHNTSTGLNALKIALGANLRDVVYSKLLVNQSQESADHSKFHLFAIFKLPDGTFVGGNAYGRLSGPGKHYPVSVKEIARGDERLVRSKVESKARAKSSGRGYSEV